VLVVVNPPPPSTTLYARFGDSVVSTVSRKCSEPLDARLIIILFSPTMPPASSFAPSLPPPDPAQSR
jgi:hypothetical protein